MYKFNFIFVTGFFFLKHDTNCFVKIDRWQGYHIGLKSRGIRSLLKCIPSSVASNLPKAIPNPIPDVEFHGVSISDHTGNLIIKPPTKQVKEIPEMAKVPDEFS